MAMACNWSSYRSRGFCRQERFSLSDFPQDRLPHGTQVDGVVGARDRLIFGWAVDLQNPSRRICVEIFVGGRRVGSAMADRCQELTRHGADGCQRFAFYYDGPLEEGGGEVAACERDSGTPLRTKNAASATDGKHSGPPLSIDAINLGAKVEIVGRVGSYPGKNLALEVWLSGKRMPDEIPLSFTKKNRAFSAEVPPELLPSIFSGGAELALPGLKEANAALPLSDLTFATATWRDKTIVVQLGPGLRVVDSLEATICLEQPDAQPLVAAIAFTSNTATFKPPPDFRFAFGSIQIFLGGTPLPMRFYQGQIESLSHRKVKGWATEMRQGEFQHPNLTVLVDGRTVGRLTPSLHRAHLERAGVGDGTFGFNFSFPTLIRADSIVEVVSDSGIRLQSNDSTKINFERELIGHLDVLNHQKVAGWASEIRDGEYHQPNLSVIVDGQVVGWVRPEDYRNALARRGIGDGRFGFSFNFPKLIHKNSKVEVTSDIGVSLSRGEKTRIGFAPAYSAMVVHVSAFDKDAISSASRVALYVTFSSSGKFHDFQKAQVNELRSAGYYVVGIHAAVDTPGDWLSSRLCDVDIFKKNVGYDFGSWCVGIQWLDQFAGDYQARLHNLILMNDSCIGTLSRRKIEEISRSLGDVAGITDNLQRGHHLQSYFISCQGNYLTNGEFSNLLRDYIFPSDKQEAIDCGELRLSQHLANSGAVIAAHCSYFDLATRWLDNLPAKMEREKSIYRLLGFSKGAAEQAVETSFLRVLTDVRQRTPINPSHYFWEEILDSGVTLVKRGLLLSNPGKVPDYLSLCRRCVETGITSIDELERYLIVEKEPSVLPSLLRLLERTGSLTIAPKT